MTDDTANQILAGLLLVLSKQIEAEHRAKGHTKSGDDFTDEAVALLREKQPRILASLRRTPR